MLRLALFFATNIAVLVLISLVFNLLGFQGVLAANGVDLDLQALLVYSAVIGFSGS
ncbi:MAG: zinc metalloprotease HtpX, partial [Pseudomonadota bacterium]|nr:zinc metalloprotease HtpX [Pseudomonadota bacterium]